MTGRLKTPLVIFFKAGRQKGAKVIKTKDDVWITENDKAYMNEFVSMKLIEYSLSIYFTLTS